MKKLVSCLLIVVMVVGMGCTALAKDNPFPQLDARISALEETYGFDIRPIKDAGFNSQLLTDAQADQLLTHLEAELPLIGSVLTKRFVSIYDSREWAEFKVDFEREGWYGSWNTGLASKHNGIVMFAGANYGDFTHEFGHALDYAMDDQLCDRFEQITGASAYVSSSNVYGYVPSTYDATKFVSHYASTTPKEDFAETFRVVISEPAPNTAAPDTAVYKKKMFLLDTLLEEFGPGSNATRRAAAHMGVDLETYRK